MYRQREDMAQQPPAVIHAPAERETPEQLYDPDAFSAPQEPPIWVWIAAFVGIYLITR